MPTNIHVAPALPNAVPVSKKITNNAKALMVRKPIVYPVVSSAKNAGLFVKLCKKLV